MSGREIAGYIIGGAGVVGVGIGAVLGGLAMSKRSELEEYNEGNCGGPLKTCDGPSKDLHSSAESLAAGSTVGFAIGAAAIVGGLVLILTAPTDGEESAPEAAALLVPTIGPSAAGLTLTGTF